MAFTTEEILSYFTMKGPNPLSKKIPENIDILPTPGRGLYARRQEAASELRSDNAGDYAFGMPHGGEAGELRSPGFSEPVYNLDHTEDIDVREDYFQQLGTSRGGDDGTAAFGDTAARSLYERYSFATDHTPHLPVTERREDVVRTIESNQVTIIQGATGCGKSTLVPQYILEHYAARQRHCNVVCTQPRRIATRSIAQYVSKTRGWKMGTLVGYQIYNDKVTSEDTRLTFVTTGVLLEKLIGNKNMNEYTHVILDEVHERNLETDLCLLLVRKLLRTNSRQVKVILMSATLESQEYAQYFGVRLPSQQFPTPAPVLSVDGRVWPVMEFYLDDLRAFGEVEGLVPDNPRVSPTQRMMCRALIDHFNQVELEDPNYGRGDFFRGTVLCFLPGMPDIRDMERTLQENQFCTAQRINILPLHSAISPEEQYRVFLHPESGQRKVILATNIAESSITVPDIKYVVDFCMVKELLTDQETGFDRLVTTWASKAALRQRKGRAGRVAEGRCYRLIKRELFRKYCPTFSVPEMQRRSVEHPVLKTKKLDMGEPCAILSLALQPPSRLDIEKAVTNLKELGAITVTCGGVVNPVDGDLTFVGSILEALPISARLGRLLLLGYVFNCLEETLVIAAALSQRSIFTRPFNNEIKAYRSKISWMAKTNSDCIAVLNAYKAWLRLKDGSQMRVRDRREQSWAHDHMLHLNGLREVGETVRDLSSRLARFGIQALRDLARTDLSKKDLLILKVVLCGAFYPNYFRWGIGDEEMNRRLFCGHNHCTTVMLAGLPSNGPKYAEQICHLFSDCVDPKGPHGKALHFDGSKVFIEFGHRHPRSGQAVLDSVLLALKKRHLREPLSLHIISEKFKMLDIMPRPGKEAEKLSDSGILEIKPVELPRSGEMEITVTQVIDAGHFWVHRSDRASHRSLRSIMESITNRTLLPFSADPQRLQGSFCLAMFAADGLYYRARVDSTNLHRDLATVTFVDYGNTETVPLTCLTRLTREECQLPAQAMECYLTCVRPAAAHSAEGSAWAESANTHFDEVVRDRKLVARVTLKGPTSPYEVKFYCMTNVGSLRPSHIERDSVNSIVVDPEPQSKHEKMMVAANVALNPSGSATLARETTLMPSILGLPYLLCLLFAPSVEMRCDTKKRRYVGAICGLGCDPVTSHSLHRDHDIELVFDTHITQEDLGLVNCVRSCMNVMLSTDSAERGVVAWGSRAVRKIQEEARANLLLLLEREREQINPHSSPRRGWNQVPPSDILLPQQPLMRGGVVDVDLEEGPDILVPFPLLSGIALTGMGPREVKGRGRMSVGELKESVRELHSKASKSEIPETLFCTLCDPTGLAFSTPRELLDHIHSRSHMARERRLWDDGQAVGLIAELLTTTIQ